MKVASTSLSRLTRKRRKFPPPLVGSSSASAPLYQTAVTRRMKKMTNSSCHRPFKTSSRAAFDRVVNQARAQRRYHRRNLTGRSMMSKPTGLRNTSRARMAILSESSPARTSSSLLATPIRRMPSIANNRCLTSQTARTSTPQQAHRTTKNH